MCYDAPNSVAMDETGIEMPTLDFKHHCDGGVTTGTLERPRPAKCSGRGFSVVEGSAAVPGATHLLEEPGTFEQVATQASDWLARWLATGRGIR
jgi:hypothetical protein